MTDSSLSRRTAGVLLHVSSLPGSHGIGDLGPAARRWVDSLARAKQSWWQVLPLTPPGDGDSPYQCFSAFAGNANFISLEDLEKGGLLRRADLGSERFPVDRVDFSRVNAFKSAKLKIAHERFRNGAGRVMQKDWRAFIDKRPLWLDDFALFMALKEATPGKSWTDWPRELVLRKPAALREAHRALADAVDRQRFIQFLFFRQLDALRAHARERGVQLVGDLPMFVSGESADVWANPGYFLLDRDRRPKAVAGVPPDYFSETGQRWGNPLFNWPALRRDGFGWWIDRIRATLAQVDLVRIDHFRGFAAYWKIPAHLPTAVGGKWVKAPGVDLFEAMKKSMGDLPLIAEDLGLITPDVELLRERFNLPGMRVLQFAFGGDAANPFLPHNYVENAVVYTGTHDNDTTAGWYASLSRNDRTHLLKYLGRSTNPKPRADEIAWELIRAAWSSVARHAVAPAQDILRLGTDARMNVPGQPTGNWAWRLKPGEMTDRLLDQLGELTETYGRAPKK